MSLKLGNTNINKAYLGSTEINKAYLGSTLVYETADPFEVYTNLFGSASDLTGAEMVLDQSAGTVTIESAIGTLLPSITNAVTMQHSSVGQTNLSIDLGQDYTELYVQWYTTVLDKSTAANYAVNGEVGSARAANEAAQVFMRHNSPDNVINMFGEDTAFRDLDTRTALGSWDKIGLHISATEVKYYVNEKLEFTSTPTGQALRYVTLGGNANNSAGYKQQFAALSVNTDHFQDIITNANGVGSYKSQFVDYSSTYNTDYNGVDLSAIDKSKWTGLHTEPFDPDGGTNYIDGAVPHLFDASGTSGYALIFGKPDSKYFLKRGVSHKIENLARTNQLAVASAGNYSATVFNTLDAYGTGTIPTLDMGMLADSTAWTTYDAPNNIYRIAIANSGNCTGAFQDDGLGLREVYTLAWMTNEEGCWFEDGTYLYVRLWDETDPSLQDITISTNQNFSATPYTEIQNIQFRYGRVLVSDNSLLENCEFTLGAGATVTESTFRDNNLFDNWAGIDYGRTQANTVPSTEGYGGSGQGGLGLRQDALIYRNTISGSYLSVTATTSANDAYFVFNDVKNTIVNAFSITLSDGDGNVLIPVIVANNTFFQSPRAVDNDPYPLSENQPGHAFVVQSITDLAYFKFFNNMMLLHNTDNISVPSVMNTMSFTDFGAANSNGQIGYNKYYITPISTSPAVIFNLGAGNNIETWRTTLASQTGTFTDMDGTSDPDTTSTVETVLPVTQADATLTSGKFLTTDGTPIETGGGYDYSALYISKGITTDLSGNPITSTLNIGAY